MSVGVHIPVMVHWIQAVQDWVNPFLQGMFGVVCVHCREAIAEDRLPLCTECAAEIPYTIRSLRLDSDYLKQAWCMAPYRSVLGSLVRRGKYASQRAIFEELGNVLAGAALDLPAVDAIVSVPLPNIRKMHRGFNQSTILARRVAEVLDLPQYEILFRVDQREQAGKSTLERRMKLTGRFEVRPHFDAAAIPSRIVIVDDVMTTGSTAESCALELLNLGVKEVFVLVLVSG